MYFTFYILHLAVCRTFLDVDMIYAPSVVNVDIFSSTLRQPIATRFKASVTKLGAIFYLVWCPMTKVRAAQSNVCS